MKKLLTIFFILFCFSVNATNYYIKTGGNDGNTGLSDAQAWGTITKFNSFFASLSPGDSILFRRGDTFYGTLTISRSGTSGSPIIVGAYGSGAKPIITGLTTVSSWTSSGGGIYTSTSAVTANTTLNMVTFQDTLQPMGRWPKATAASNGYLLFQSHTGGTTRLQTITSNAIGSALSYVGGEVVVKKIQWILDRARITAQSSTVVTYTGFTCPAHPTVWYQPNNGYGFFFQNHINACTVLGEWAYDSTNRKIQMYFGGASPASYSIKVTDLETLVDISSKSYVTFDNIQFKGSNSQSFNINVCNNIQINSCDFDFAGVNTIVATSSSTNNIRVYNCTINHTNNVAIAGQSAPSWSILNNIVRNTAMIRGMGVSGDAQYNGMSYIGGKSLVQYNQVINTGYCGIQFIGDSVTIKNNLVDSFCMIKTDGGGIYTYAETTTFGRKIVGNIVLNGIGDKYGIGTNPDPSVHGIYLDGGARNVEITGNTSYNNWFSGIILNYPQNVNIQNNTFYDNGSEDNTLSAGILIGDDGTMITTTIKHNIVVAKRSSEGILYINGGNRLSSLGTFDSNYYCRPISEPTGINTLGFSDGIPYNDGGIILNQASGIYRFYSLDTWRTLSSQDAHSIKSPKTITDVNDLRFEYNATTANKTVSLPYNYMDVKGAIYNGTITLLPYTSAVLIKNGAILPFGAAGIFIKRKVIIHKN